ncbi:hypothetical protein BJ138DRAFT_804999 [Hygrophoropsis aurantiaca]|uniref:Uncharacterized protein n=1 Tax=Hygrophoropsis aurantiaca TaxID=72124 RepID=A0ACB8AGF2_9AGAM|nr:hypothetical protein BJ138DRAFT_804999 [Hygrophoropsis aurantiaca]
MLLKGQETNNHDLYALPSAKDSADKRYYYRHGTLPQSHTLQQDFDTQNHHNHFENINPHTFKDYDYNRKLTMYASGPPEPSEQLVHTVSRRRAARKSPREIVYPCRWGDCQQCIPGDRNKIRMHLKNHHRIPVDGSQVKCGWMACCRSEIRGDTIPRHVQMHLKVRWACSGCGTLFTRQDSGTRHAEKGPCVGAVMYELPGPDAVANPGEWVY